MECRKNCNCPNCNEELARMMRMDPTEYSAWLNRTQQQVQRLNSAGGQEAVMRHAARAPASPVARRSHPRTLATANGWLARAERGEGTTIEERMAVAALQQHETRGRALARSNAAPSPPDLAKFVRAKRRGLDNAAAMSEARQ